MNATESLSTTQFASATPVLAPQSDFPKAQYRAILQRAVDDGARRAAALLTSIERDQPRDQVLRMTAARFEVPDGGGLHVAVGSDGYTATDFALSQIAGRAGIPCPTYANSPQRPRPLGSELAIEILRQHHGHGNGRVSGPSVRTPRTVMIVTEPRDKTLRLDRQSLRPRTLAGVSTKRGLAFGLMTPMPFAVSPRSKSSRDAAEPFEQRMTGLVAQLQEQFAEGARLENTIRESLQGLGYGR